MTEVVIVCEGRTEETFSRKVLGPTLASRQVYVLPRHITMSTISKGGAFSRQRVLHFLRNTVREREDTYVTTFFDLYRLPSDFPGRSEATQRDHVKRAIAIETRFHAEIIHVAGRRPDQFFPHIQPYEFESLLFSDTLRFMEVEPSWRKFACQLATARKSVESPEHVNDGDNTHPSARLDTFVFPGYRKVQHGAAISMHIGLACMRAECRHFDGWVTRLEGISLQ